jgi:hypothetical protein
VPDAFTHGTSAQRACWFTTGLKSGTVASCDTFRDEQPRVFLPMLIVSAAAYSGHLSLDNSFAWLGTPAALIMLSVAAVAEILAYYIPVVDNLLDSLATPAAFIAGTVVSAAVMTDVPPMVKWTAAVIAGGRPQLVLQALNPSLHPHRRPRQPVQVRQSTLRLSWTSLPLNRRKNSIGESRLSIL